MSDLKDPMERLYADDACLVRYLRAREYNLNNAEALLRGTLEWRRDYGIENVSAEDMAVGEANVAVVSARRSLSLLHWPKKGDAQCGQARQAAKGGVAGGCFGGREKDTG
jgi:hypothetical protein